MKHSEENKRFFSECAKRRKTRYAGNLPSTFKEASKLLGISKMPPTSPIKKWIDVRKIKPKDMTRDQLAFVIARSINMKVSFDFDGTLERPIIQQMAKKHINAGDEVFIITRRCHDRQ